VQIVREINSQPNGLQATVDQLRKKLEAESRAKSEALKAKEDALNRLSNHKKR
jgi:outer membrane murein-binding lipoprotein Lpp